MKKHIKQIVGDFITEHAQSRVTPPTYRDFTDYIRTMNIKISQVDKKSVVRMITNLFYKIPPHGDGNALVYYDRSTDIYHHIRLTEKFEDVALAAIEDDYLDILKDGQAAYIDFNHLWEV